jgi:hypothetical protein
VKTINSKLLSYDAADKKFSIDMSELRGFERIYPDACDEGFAIQSDKTNDIAVFSVFKVEKDSEDDIQYWVLIPTTETLRDMPKIRYTTVFVYND